MFLSAAFPAPAALLPWAGPSLPPIARYDASQPGPPSGELPALERRVPAMERATRDRCELVIGLVEGPGLSPFEDACVESLLRHLKAVWRIASPHAARSVHFRRLPIPAPEDAQGLAPLMSEADLIWLQVAEGSPLVNRPLEACLPQGTPPGVMLALLRRERLMLNPEPAKLLQALDGVVLRGAR